METKQRKVLWGVLGAARIATTKVIPAMQKGVFSRVVGLGSRDRSKAQAAVAGLGIERVYGSYEELLEDPEIDAIYNPLPNHLHLPWSLKAAAAGKHVLCEKPITTNAAEIEQLIAARDRYGVKIAEAFMVRCHPQWLRAQELLASGELGRLCTVITAFSYHNANPANIRNIPEYGGGALMDIGCYAVHISRWLFRDEPIEVSAAIERDPAMGIDRLTSALLSFRAGHAIFTCGTQMTPFQRVQLLCTEGRLELEIPFNAPPDRPSRIHVITGEGQRTEEMPVCDQYTLQGDSFSRAILEDGPVPLTLEDSLLNMTAIDRIFEAAKT